MKKAKLIRVNFVPNSGNPSAYIIALVDKEKEGFEKIVKEAFSNWSTDNNTIWDKSLLNTARSCSSYSFIGNIELEEAYSDWEDFNIIHFQKTPDYKVS